VLGKTTTSIDIVTKSWIFRSNFQIRLIFQGRLLHYLTLNFGAPINRLRYINPPRFCNGTRFLVKQTMNNISEATIWNRSKILRTRCTFNIHLNDSDWYVIRIQTLAVLNLKIHASHVDSCTGPAQVSENLIYLRTHQTEK